MIEVFEAQFLADLAARISALEATSYSCKKRRCDPTKPAHTFCGEFTGLSHKIRYCDVDEYIGFLKDKFTGFLKEPR